MTSNNKNLTLLELKKQDKKLNQRETFTLNIGSETYEVSHDVKFRKTKQHKVIEDIVMFFEAGSKDMVLLELATPYTALLIIKHFTSLEVSDDIDEALAMLNVLVDLEVLDIILAELPETEVTQIYELLQRTISDMNDNIEIAEKEAREISNEIQNDEVKEMITDGTNE